MLTIAFFIETNHITKESVNKDGYHEKMNVEEKNDTKSLGVQKEQKQDKEYNTSGIVTKEIFYEKGELIAEVAYENGEEKETHVNKPIIPNNMENTAKKKQVHKGKTSDWDIEKYKSLDLPDWTWYAAKLTNHTYNECVERDIVDSDTKWTVSVQKYYFEIPENDLEIIKKEIEQLLREQSVIQVVQNSFSTRYHLEISLNKEREENGSEVSVITCSLVDDEIGGLSIIEGEWRFQKRIQL